MTYWTLGQAAKETGRSKSLLHKALKDGRLSFVEKTQSGYKIDPAEVFRVFPPEHSKENETEQTCTPENTIKNELYEQKIAFLEREITAMKEQLGKHDEREQQHLTIISRQSHLIEHLSKREEPTETEKQKKRRFLWW